MEICIADWWDLAEYDFHLRAFMYDNALNAI